MKKVYGGATGREPADESIRSKRHGRSQTSHGKSTFTLVDLIHVRNPGAKEGMVRMGIEDSFHHEEDALCALTE